MLTSGSWRHCPPLPGLLHHVWQTTVPLILQTLRTVLSQGVEIQLKILQTLVSLLTNCKDIHNDMLAEVRPAHRTPLPEE